jgi:hypothetical protein
MYLREHRCDNIKFRNTVLYKLPLLLSVTVQYSSIWLGGVILTNLSEL